MATHKSAEKRHRQSLKRRTRNRNARSTIRTQIRTVLETITSGDAAAAQEKAKKAASLLDKAVVHGLLHRKTAQRTLSRLDKKVAAVQ